MAQPLVAIPITSLPLLVTPDDDDQMLVYDTSAGVTKRTTIGAGGGGAAERLEVGLSGDFDDFDPGSASWLNVTTSAAQKKITGISGGVDGRVIRITCDPGGQQFVLSGEDTGSTAANRMTFGIYQPAINIGQGESVDMIYDATMLRWRPLSWYRAEGFRWQPKGSLEDLTFANSGTAAATSAYHGGYNMVLEGELHTGTNSAGWASMHGTLNYIANSSGQPCQMLMVMPIYNGSDLSDGTNRFTQRAGFLDAASGEPTNGAYFRYCDNLNSGKWQLVCRNGGVETAADSGVAFVVNDYSVLGIVIYNTYVDFFMCVNASDPYRMQFVGRVASNVPTGSGSGFGWGASITKSLGTADRLMYTYKITLDVNGV